MLVRIGRCPMDQLPEEPILPVKRKLTSDLGEVCLGSGMLLEDLGPQTHEEMFMWPSTFLTQLRSWAGSADLLFDRAINKFERGVQMSSSYSGLGTAELAMHWLKQGFRLRGFLFGPNSLQCLRASDVDESCRAVLEHMSNSDCGPACICGSLQERAPRDFVRQGASQTRFGLLMVLEVC